MKNEKQENYKANLSLPNLNNINEKSFEDYSIKDFKQINCFFGINGSGKSALARAISKQFAMNNFIKFDTIFVNNNISLEDNKKDIKGINLKTGKQVELEKTINKYKLNLDKFNEGKEKMNKDLADVDGTLYRMLNEIVDNAKLQFKTSKIHQKTNAKDEPVQAVKKWKEEINNNELNFQESFNNISELKEELDQSAFKWNSAQRIVDYINKIDFHKFISQLRYSIPKDLNGLDGTAIEWLKDGLKFNNLDSPTGKCLFCGNTFDSKQVKDRINRIIKSEFSLQLEGLAHIKKQLSDLIDILKNDAVLNQSLKADLISSLKKFLNKIKDKNSEIGVSVEISQNDTKEFNKEYDQLKKKENRLRNQYNELQDILRHADLYVKQWIGLQVENNSDIKKLVKENANLNIQIKQQNKEIIVCERKIKELQQQQGSYQEFVLICNNEFKKLGIRLKIKINSEDTGYQIESSDGFPLELEDISEGEKRILAFLEFFFEMRESKTKIKNNIKAIIIDDPITSLDSENAYEMIEMINNLIETIKGYECQLFIFTNSSQAFHEIAYDQPFSNIGRWYIRKNVDGKSVVKKVELDEFLNRSDYYRNLFCEIAQLAFENNNDLESLNNALFYCNKTRILLESNVYANYNISNATSSSSNFKKLIDIFKIRTINKKNQLKKDLDIINVNSHGFSILDDGLLNQTFSNKEIQIAIQDIIGLLYSKNSDHVEYMLEGLKDINSNKIKGKSEKLKDWANRWRNE